MLRGMQRRLEGKRALVTAGAQGIGEAIVHALAEAGAQVLATDVNADALAALERVPGVRTAPLDVCDTAAVNALVAREVAAHGAFDVLLNVAGHVHHGTVLDCDERAWNHSFDLNVTSMHRTVRAVLPGMLDAGGGSIVNISSICAHKGLPNRLAYGASKAAVDGFSKAVAADYVARGVRCNTIRPGTVQSPSLDERIGAFDDPVQARKDFIARQPMGRMGVPAEIAALALYLASDESVFVTGALFNIDGGMSI